MIPEQQNVEIVKACGWVRVPPEGRNKTQLSANWDIYTKDGRFASYRTRTLPNYVGDLNAMQSAVLYQPPEFRARFDELQQNVCITRKCIMAELTAEDWAILFLQVKHEMMPQCHDAILTQ